MTKQEREEILGTIEDQSYLFYIARALINTSRGSREKTMREKRDLFRFTMQARDMGISQKAIDAAIQRGRDAA